MASYNKSKQVDITTSERLIYYDITLSNVDSANSDNTNQLIFKDRRDTPIINSIKDYRMSILRFELSTWSLPVFYFQPKTNSNDPLEGIYSVTLCWRTPGSTISTDPVNLIFVAQDNSLPVPAAPSTFPNGISTYNEYYFVYNFNNLIDMLNEALLFSFTKLQGDVSGALDTAKAPIVVWNDNLTASIYSELDFYDVTADNHVEIFFNRPLFSLFNSFPMEKFTPTDTGKHYQILTNPRSGIQTTTIPAYSSAQLIKIDQEFPTNESWSPINSIVFTTTMAVLSSVQSNPTVYQNGVQQYLSNTYNNTQTIISDFQTDQNNYRSTVFYLPTSQYRYISLLNNDVPLYEINIYGWVKDRYGILRPLTLPSNSIFSMKILFERL